MLGSHRSSFGAHVAFLMLSDEGEKEERHGKFDNDDEDAFASETTKDDMERFVTIEQQHHEERDSDTKVARVSTWRCEHCSGA